MKSNELPIRTLIINLQFLFYDFVNRPQKVKITKPSEMEKIKVALLGEGGVGKTSIAKRFSEDSFSSAYEPTIAVDY